MTDSIKIDPESYSAVLLAESSAVNRQSWCLIVYRQFSVFWFFYFLSLVVALRPLKRYKGYQNHAEHCNCIVAGQNLAFR